MPQRAEEMTIAQRAAWLLELVDRWPEVFSLEEISTVWQQGALACREIQDPEEKSAVHVSFLRAATLRLVHQKVNTCTRCELAENRLSGRGVTSDSSWANDPYQNVPGETPLPVGPSQAKIMMIAEGPGQFEQRTGQPQVSYQVLAGSVCAQKCANYEICYPAGASMPQAPCQPARLERLAEAELTELGHQERPEELIAARCEEIRTRRAQAKPWKLHTAGQKLDECLFKAGLFRENWNDRLLRIEPEKRKIEPQPGTVYVCNLVKCRSCRPDPKNGGRLKDAEPTQEQIRACSLWLDIQRHVVQPQVIVTLGALAGATLTGKPKFPVTGEARTQLHEGPDGVPLVAEVHPSYIIRQLGEAAERTLTEGMIENFQKALDLVRGGFVPVAELVGEAPTPPAGGPAPEAPVTPETLEHLPRRAVFINTFQGPNPLEQIQAENTRREQPAAEETELPAPAGG